MVTARLCVGCLLAFLLALLAVVPAGPRPADRPAPRSALRPAAADAPPVGRTAPSRLRGYTALQWVYAFPPDCAGNASSGHQCKADTAVALMVSDAFAVAPDRVAVFGMWGKRRRQFGDPVLWCASEAAPDVWVKASVYIVRFFDPFNWFEALCHFPNVSFPEGSATYITLKGSAVVKRVRVEGHRAPAPTHGIAVCLSQFHNRIPNRVLLEFLEYYRLLGVTYFFLYDFDVRFTTLQLVRRFEAERPEVEVELIDWSPVQRYPSYCRGQVLALNDAFMRARHRARFLVQLDLDEVLFSPQHTHQPHGSLLRSLEAWQATVGDRPLLAVFARYDFQNFCAAPSPNASLLHLPRLQHRCALPSAYSAEGPRQQWLPFVQSGFSWGGFPKFAISTAVDPYCGGRRCFHLHVHTAHLGRPDGLRWFLPDLQEWRINHYRGWTPSGRCGQQPRPWKPCMVFQWYPQPQGTEACSLAS
eukprot:EG_transcript_11263